MHPSINNSQLIQSLERRKEKEEEDDEEKKGILGRRKEPWVVDGVSVSGGDGGQHTVTKSQLAERQLCVCAVVIVASAVHLFSFSFEHFLLFHFCSCCGGRGGCCS